MLLGRCSSGQCERRRWPWNPFKIPRSQQTCPAWSGAVWHFDMAAAAGCGTQCRRADGFASSWVFARYSQSEWPTAALQTGSCCRLREAAPQKTSCKGKRSSFCTRPAYSKGFSILQRCVQCFSRPRPKGIASRQPRLACWRRMPPGRWHAPFCWKCVRTIDLSCLAATDVRPFAQALEFEGFNRWNLQAYVWELRTTNSWR